MREENKTEERDVEQARAQLNAILEMMQQYNDAEDSDDYDALDDVEQTMRDNALSIKVRSGWGSPGDCLNAEEYRVLLCTGGPAVQIVGELNEHREPETAELQHQDWFSPWTEYADITEEEEEILLEYVRIAFWFGE